MRWSMPRIQAGRSHSCLARSPAARITAGAPSPEDHGGGAVADGRAVAGAQRAYDVVARGHRPLPLCMGVGGGVGPAAGADRGERGFVGLPRVDEGLRLEGGQGHGIGPQGSHVVRVELPGQYVPHRTR